MPGWHLPGCGSLCHENSHPIAPSGWAGAQGGRCHAPSISGPEVAAVTPPGAPCHPRRAAPPVPCCGRGTRQAHPDGQAGHACLWFCTATCWTQGWPSAHLLSQVSEWQRQLHSAAGLGRKAAPGPEQPRAGAGKDRLPWADPGGSCCPSGAGDLSVPLHSWTVLGCSAPARAAQAASRAGGAAWPGRSAALSPRLPWPLHSGWVPGSLVLQRCVSCGAAGGLSTASTQQAAWTRPQRGSQLLGAQLPRLENGVGPFRWGPFILVARLRGVVLWRCSLYR